MVNINIKKVVAAFKNSNDVVELEKENEKLLKVNAELKADNKSLKNKLDELEATVKELEVYVPVEHQYKLRLNSQAQSDNMRYYFRSCYLLSAPAEYKEKIEAEFNKLMGFGLSANEVKQELKFYKNDLVANGVNPVRLHEL